MERLLKAYLKKELGGKKTSRSSYCLKEELLLDYLGKRLTPQEEGIIEAHLANCGFCLSQLSLAFQAQGFLKQKEEKKISPELIKETKRLLLLKRKKGKKPCRKKIKKELFYLIATLVSFLISFLVPQYFLQFLILTLILGIRWALESEGGKTLIMVWGLRQKASSKQREKEGRRMRTPL